MSYCRYHLLDLEMAREVAPEIFLTAFAGMAGFRRRLLHQDVALWDRVEEVPGSRTHQETPRSASPQPPGHHWCTGALRSP